MHTGRDPFHAWNFRRAEPENIASAESSLILLSEGTARRRQHRHAERQAGHECEISDFEPINSHHRPRKGLTLRSSAARFATLESIEINQDRIEISADPSRFVNSYAPEFSITASIAASWFQKWNIVTGGRELANESAASCFGPTLEWNKNSSSRLEVKNSGGSKIREDIMDRISHLDRITHCPKCGKQMVPVVTISGRTDLQCIICEDPAVKWAESPLIAPEKPIVPERV